MKKFIKLFTIAFVSLAFAANTFAQTGDTEAATATATIITPIAIAKANDLAFGNVAVSATAGTVVLANDGTRTATGGVTLPAITGTVSQATFNVTGINSATYDINLPADGTVSITSGANSMNINSFTTDGTGTLSAAGAETINVGATLLVGASQPSGTYTGTFDVNVDYN
jgi:hypothetical protein